MKTLVVYFSRKGYAKRVAEAIAKERGADIERIETTERTAGFLGFWWCGRFGMHRWGMPIKPLRADASRYDRVVIVSPIWVFAVCAPVRTFVSQQAGRVRGAEYVFLHYSNPMRYDKTAARMDRALGLTRASYTSVRCVLGHMKERVFPTAASAGPTQ